MRCLIVLLLCASSDAGQSISISGGHRSIIVSGATVAEAVPVVIHQVPPAPVERAVQPTVPPPPEVVQVTPAVPQWFLVSEPWCGACPAAKARFEAKGWPKENILTIAQAKARFGFTVPHVPYEFRDPGARTLPQAQPVQRVVERTRLPVVNTEWGRIDLETYNRNCNCPMCRGIRALQKQYREPQQSQVSPEQEPTPAAAIDDLFAALQLTPQDTLADLGCGDGRILVEAVQRTGCRAIGVEIDPKKAEDARRRVLDSGLSKRISIITGDALEFDPGRHQVTAISAYLYPELLNQLTPVFKHPGVRVVVTPYHQVPGIPMSQTGDVWTYRPTSSTVFGSIGTSHESRESLIKHMLTEGEHIGRHTPESLSRLTDQQLSDLHDRDHIALARRN